MRYERQTVHAGKIFPDRRPPNIRGVLEQPIVSQPASAHPKLENEIGTSTLLRIRRHGNEAGVGHIDEMRVFGEGRSRARKVIEHWAEEGRRPTGGGGIEGGTGIGGAVVECVVVLVEDHVERAVAGRDPN
jgi:hypothetical protein